MEQMQASNPMGLKAKEDIKMTPSTIANFKKDAVPTNPQDILGAPPFEKPTIAQAN
jgi:hypothetical protein